jgi:hypothetical protein
MENSCPFLSSLDGLGYFFPSPFFFVLSKHMQQLTAQSTAMISCGCRMGHRRYWLGNILLINTTHTLLA